MVEITMYKAHRVAGHAPQRSEYWLQPGETNALHE